MPIDQLPRSTAERTVHQVICVRRLSAEKGQAGLLDAFARIRERVKDAELIVIGSGPDNEALRRKVACLGLE